jgi:glycosyltransferase involved in cell wall biosynthesis
MAPWDRKANCTGGGDIVKFLFVKYDLHWPRAAGHDVHAYEMAKALGSLGSAVGLATVVRPTEAALDGLKLDLGVHSLAPTRWSTGSVCKVSCPPPPLTYLQRRFIRYWGIEAEWVETTCALVKQIQPDVVIAPNVQFLPLLAAIDGPIRVWYPADEYCRHHLSQFKLFAPKSWKHFLFAMINALYERTYAPCYDRAWVVTPQEAWAMRWLANARAVDIIPNGVDAEHYQPMEGQQISNSCVFWGRLESGPNVDAVKWFSRCVWRTVKTRSPSAEFYVYGFSPNRAIQRLADEGVKIIADAPDLRQSVCCCQVAVLPFISGGGIKNKLLEAAALGMPIVASPLACQGLEFNGGTPLVQAKSPREWVASLLALWQDVDLRRRLGHAARSWVVTQHTWEAAARRVLSALGQSTNATTMVVSSRVEVPACPSS